uniref:Uncharacterized protein n=1 Tax=Anguilla anguilla TaxID=7936 RepID=A0A0E9TXI9_ANGAN
MKSKHLSRLMIFCTACSTAILLCSTRLYNWTASKIHCYDDRSKMN